MTSTKSTAKSPATTDEAPAEVEPVNYIDLVESMGQGDKMHLKRALDCTAGDLATLGSPEQLVAAAWKHRRDTTGATKVTDLVNLSDQGILDVLGLSREQFSEQVRAYIEAQQAPKSDD